METQALSRTIRFESRSVGDDGRIEGYGSVFGVTDAYSDIIASGAFDNSLAEHRAAGTMPAMLWQHNADTPCGVWEDMREDARGLRVEGRLALDTQAGREAHALLKMGALNGLSIGFVSKQWSYDRDSETRTLTEIDLWEVSIVTFPANQRARIDAVKAVNTIRDAERFLRDEGRFSERAAKAFIAKVKGMFEDEREARDELVKAHAAAERLLSSLKS